MPAAGVKAKWVHVELRKVETLPDAGEANTYYDFVGLGPVNLWSAPDEYSLLYSVSSIFLDCLCFCTYSYGMGWLAKLPVLYPDTRVDTAHYCAREQRWVLAIVTDLG